LFGLHKQERPLSGPIRAG
jgi:hypothetical protein